MTSREDHGGTNRVKAARLVQVKTLDEVDLLFRRSVKRTKIAHLAFLGGAHNLVILGPPGIGCG